MKSEGAKAKSFYQTALLYSQSGDIYNAVKLYKKVIKMVPDWSAPYVKLAAIYKKRQEWKPCLYYSQMAYMLDKTLQNTLEDIGIAATQRGLWEVARKAWNLLDFDFPESQRELRREMGIIPVRLQYNGYTEIIWAKRIDPARAYIYSIPQPASSFYYGDLLLIEVRERSHHIVANLKYPVFDQLDIIKRSKFKTYSIVLETGHRSDVEFLEQICMEYELGFDNWSNASLLQLNLQSNPHREYYGTRLIPAPERDHFLVAIAAPRKTLVYQVLKEWHQLTLRNYSRLHRLNYQ